ncbi:hypothetical protein HGRIS_002240 [Hohenbuehelia grisea]|uniref:C2H2-type domain-containing protein n=1 Tax=Hohenbuehelia grisea TaxID=104357 RepID=A0ABR3JK06_9AGAR
MAQSNPQFTCLSCSIAFHSPEEQRLHYHSDHHRYNMKRRVAGLPPVSLTIYNQKLAERAPDVAPAGADAPPAAGRSPMSCAVCNKSYTTENAYRSHINSKKHKENEAKPPRPASQPSTSAAASTSTPASAPQSDPSALMSVREIADEDEPTDADTDAAIAAEIDAKIAAAPKLSPETDCLFCNTTSASLDETLAHMASAHSFFVPDAEYLIDLPGLLRYLGEKLAIGNLCIYCNLRSREYRSLDAVRRHMADKGHCKIAYDSENDKLEVSDYYDFSSSYPAEAPESDEGDEEDAEWEDADDDTADVDEIVEVDASAPKTKKPKADADPDALPDRQQITYGDSEYELVLPSGSRIGHRAMKRYYAQSFPGARARPGEEDPNSGKALVRRLLADRNSALVPRKGGFGAFGSGTDVVKARNRGEAREAGRHVREFRDQKRREDFKTKVGYIHNSQKHFRDPLLQ